MSIDSRICASTRCLIAGIPQLSSSIVKFRKSSKCSKSESKIFRLKHWRIQMCASTHFSFFDYDNWLLNHQRNFSAWHTQKIVIAIVIAVFPKTKIYQFYCKKRSKKDSCSCLPCSQQNISLLSKELSSLIAWTLIILSTFAGRCSLGYVEFNIKVFLWLHFYLVGQEYDALTNDFNWFNLCRNLFCTRMLFLSLSLDQNKRITRTEWRIKQQQKMLFDQTWNLEWQITWLSYNFLSSKTTSSVEVLKTIVIDSVHCWLGGTAFTI